MDRDRAVELLARHLHQSTGPRVQDWDDLTYFRQRVLLREARWLLDEIEPYIVTRERHVADICRVNREETAR